MRKYINFILIFAILLSFTACSSSKEETNEPINNSIISSENYSFDTYHMWFYMKDCYIRAYNSYAEQNALSQAGIDVKKPLTEQYYKNTQQTWRDFLLSYGLDKLGQCLVICEAARENGFTLDEKSTAEINAQIEQIKSFAASQSKTVGDIYGCKDITEEHIRHVLTMQLLAENYSKHIINSFTYTDEDYKAFYDKYKDEQNYTSETYPTADIYILSVTNESDNDEKFKDACARLQQKTDALPSPATSAQFLQIAKEFTDITVNASGLRRNIAKGNIKEMLNITDFDTWAFEETRKAGDICTFTSSDGKLFTVIYYNNASIPAWQAAADNDMRNSDYATKYVELEEKYTVKVVLENANAIK